MFVEQVCACGTDAGHGAGARTTHANSVSYVRCYALLTDYTALQMQFKMYIGILCILATSAFTEPGQKAWLRHVL